MDSFVDLIKEAIGVNDDKTALEVERLMLQHEPALGKLTPEEFDTLSRLAFSEYARKVLDGR